MVFSRSIFVTILACCALSSLQAADESHRHQKKCYLDEKTISITNEGIVVTTKSGPIKVRVLRSDSHGIYVYQQDLCSEAAKGSEVCDLCGLWFPNHGAYLRHHCPYRR